MNKTTEIKTLHPAQLGWVRAPEMDGPMYDMWKKPDGTLYASPKGQTPKPLLILEQAWGRKLDE